MFGLLDGTLFSLLLSPLMFTFADGDAGGGGDGDGDEGDVEDPDDGSGNGDGSDSDDKTFTQDEVNAVVEQRLERDRKKREKEIAEAKKKAEKWDKLQEAEKSELEKAQDANAELQSDLEEANSALAQTHIEYAVKFEAQKMGAKDPDKVYRVLDLDDVEYDADSGDVMGVDEALKSLKKEAGWMFDKPDKASLDGEESSEDEFELDEEEIAQDFGIKGGLSS